VTAASATALTLATDLRAAGVLLLADAVVAAAAWSGGMATGAVAALVAVLAARLTAVPLSGATLELWPALLLVAKGLGVAAVFGALGARVRADGEELIQLRGRIQRLERDARSRTLELEALEAASAEIHAQLRDEADVARRQLTMLQSVTDPMLQALDGTELVTSLLERMCTALGADGVALYHLDKRGGRIFAVGKGARPTGSREPLADGYRIGRAMLIHNDARRVADASLCRWPEAVTSLISVPAVRGGHLQLVVEVANYTPRRSTEWELALIQVVAERAAGLLDSCADTGVRA
jgi:hypothetical protein